MLLWEIADDIMGPNSITQNSDSSRVSCSGKIPLLASFPLNRSQEFSLLFKHRIKIVIYNLFYVGYYRRYSRSISIINIKCF